MANVLTDLAADIYRAADIVGREQVGVIPSVTINGGSEGAAFGDTVRAAFTREPVLNDTYTPSMTIPEGDDQTVDNKTLVIDKVANVQFNYTGEEIKHLNNGAGYETVYGDQIAQAFRRITNEIEKHVALKLSIGASRAVGTAGTTPFGSNFDEVAEVRQILLDNGMPNDGQATLAINSFAGTKLRNLAQLQKVNEAGGEDLLRRGELLNLQGLMLKESAGISQHVKGSATGGRTNNAAGIAIGETVIPVENITAGATGYVAGDVITFASDATNKYVVEVGLASGATGNITIASPGVQIALLDNDNITVLNNYVGNVAFHRAACELVVRPPAMPLGGDSAEERITVQDPFSGIVYEIAVYNGYAKKMFDITTFYAARVWKPDFVASLLG
tara:strand:+ start:7223 stop:8389 length:1167 start_codon:yes stop_codon:yes gene_type:complete